MAQDLDDLNSPERLRWERKLLGCIRRGEQAAFAELYRAYAPSLFQHVLLPRLGDRTAAEDALSETFRKAVEALGSFESKNVSVYFWLSRIAVNKAMDMHRVKAVTQRALASFEGLLGPLQEAPSDPSSLLEDHVESALLSERIEHTLAGINERYRRAIELRFLKNHSREECATLLEVKLGTFDVLLLRALRAFRKQWEASLALMESGT